MASKDPLIGKQLANFKVERVLGRGGMAQVYYGHDIKLQRPVAIKVIDARYRNKPGYAERFVKEARAVARWRHDNIIQIYYADDSNGLYYYAMEYIDGKDLASALESYVAEGELMPVDEVVRIARAIAKGLDYAHQQGVIHRDVKPSNVLLSKDGRVVLGDFGLALDVQQGSLGEAFGTPHYISPEQVRRSSDVVPQSDLYSLGIILYEMLTGVVPFDDPSPTSVALQHITEAPPPPRSINPDLNAQTEAVLLKALSKNPQQRYQSGASLVAALDRAIKDMQDSRKPAEILPLPPMPAGLLKGDSRKTRLAGTQLEAGKKKAPPPPPAAPVEKKTDQPRRRPFWLLALLLLLAALGFCLFSVYNNPRLAAWLTALRPSQTASSQPAQPTATQPPVTAIPLATRQERLTPAQVAANPSPVTLTSTGTAMLPPTPTTATFTPTSTSTSVPTAAQTPLPPSATSTQALPTAQIIEGKRMVMFYNDDSFYLWNNSDSTRTLSAFAFERLDAATGAPISHLDGDLWAEKYPNLLPNRCVRIEIYNGTSYLNPADCRSIYDSSRILYSTDSQVFWTSQPNSQEFRVIWLDKEVGRCQISAGSCEILIP